MRHSDSIYSAFVTASLLLLASGYFGLVHVSTVSSLGLIFSAILWTVFRLFHMFLLSMDITMLISALLLVVLSSSILFYLLPPAIREFFASLFYQNNVASSPITTNKNGIRIEDILKVGLPPSDA